MVAIFGWIMPEPLAKPVNQAFFPEMEKGLAVNLGKVSVVRMAWAASTPPPRERRKAACLTPARILGMGRGTPITPVEWASTDRDDSPKSRAVKWMVV